jgi:hypothetical protein
MNEVYLSSILWYISWPVLIIITYKIISFSLRKFEKKHTK